jgi:hypothetical protein
VRYSELSSIQPESVHREKPRALQERASRTSIEVFEDGADVPRPLALFPEKRGEGLRPTLRWCDRGSAEIRHAGYSDGVIVGS